MTVLFKAFLVVASAFCLALGLVLPLVRFEKLYFFSETPSLVEIVLSLVNEGNAALGLLVAAFSIVFPVFKLLVTAAETISGAEGNAPLGRILPVLARWSMMDVLLVALTIVAVKTTGFASALTQPGLWFYAASALMTAGLNATIRRSA